MPDFIVDFPGLGIKGLEISRKAFQFELFGREISVYWYGLIMAAAFVICLVLSLRHAERYGLTSSKITDYFLFIIPMGIVGSRLYFVAFQWDLYKNNLWGIFDTRKGGLAFYGGVIFGILAIWIMARFKKQKTWRMFDYFVVYLPLGQAIGRWGNFVNQEAFGNNTTLPWGMYSNGTRSYLEWVNSQGNHLLTKVDPSMPVHPTFLYEFLGNLIIFVILLFVRKRSKRPLTTTFTYLLLYGVVRFVVEGLRTDSLYISNSEIRVSQLLSAVMIMGSLVYLIISSHLKHKNPELVYAVKAPVTAEVAANEETLLPAEDGEKKEQKIEDADAEVTGADEPESETAETETDVSLKTVSAEDKAVEAMESEKSGEKEENESTESEHDSAEITVADGEEAGTANTKSEDE